MTQTAVASTFSLQVEQIDGFEFRVKFDKEQFAPLLLDEPPPLGHDTAPNAARLLAAAIGNCLAASARHNMGPRGIRAACSRRNSFGSRP